MIDLDEINKIAHDKIADLVKSKFITIYNQKYDPNCPKDEISTGGWEWGDYDCYYYIENLADFCQFISDKNIPSFEKLEEIFSEIYEEYTKEAEGQLPHLNQ